MARLKTENHDGVLVVYFLDSELEDDLQIQEIGSELVELASQAPEKKMLISFQGVLFITSLMLGQLVLLRKVCHTKGVTVKICDIGPDLKPIFKTLRLDTLIEVGEDESSVLASMISGPVDEVAEEPAGLVEEFRSAAEQGDADSQYALAKCYEDGVGGVAQDFAEAFAWYEKAANQGHVAAQHMLGNCYAYGIHVPQNYNAAAEWFEKAGEQGHPDAQYMMGLSCNHGLAGVKNKAVAAEWYRQAAEQGHSQAQEALQHLGVG